MNYTIQNDKVTVEIAGVGGELMSVKGAGGTEYLWQGDAQYWAGRAYNLFPIVGRLFGGNYTYKGKTYEMNLHGFVRKSVLGVREHKPGRITFFLRDSEETRKSYPFAFEYTLTYTLSGTALSTEYGVKNTGAGELLFAVGGHPGFNVPLSAGEAFEDYYLEFPRGEHAKEIVCSERCFITREEKPFPLENGKILPLRHGLFDHDAVILRDMGGEVSLRSRKGGAGLTVNFDGLKYLGIWHKPLSDAPYVCLEPWSSLPSYDGETDDFSAKRDMEKLPAGGVFSRGFSITLF
jgi:galactose mutarotase-like enzyme